MDEPVHEKVSFDDEPLILVDEHDNEIGYLSKSDAHRGRGTLHRAFSVFLFDPEGRVLLQQRSASKPLWPLYWSNSCCSHPRRGETVDEATHRRVREELGLDADMEFVYKFIYQADFENGGAEHELCHVFLGTTDGEVRVHPDEIADWRWVEPEEIDRRLSEEPERFTPWFKMEWQSLMNRWRTRFEAVATRGTSA